MTKKQFWQSASNWGMITGLVLFLITILSWVLTRDAGKPASWMEFVRFVAVLAILIYTGRQNARLSGPEGYPYGRAVGWIFAMMMFAGIVAGVGDFLMANFIARDYYDGLNAMQAEAIMKVYQGTPMESRAVAMGDQMVRMLSNPFVLIFSNVINWVMKGGFLGLIVAAFVKKNPDPFAAAGPAPSCPAKDE
jgi:hypothetical protein